MNFRLLLLNAAGLIFASVALAQSPTTPDPELRGKVSAAIDKGLAYLKSQQKAEGYWSSNEYPGLTGLVVQTYLGAPGGKHRGDEAAQQGLAFIRKNARTDGGIYAERMGNYNTSVCLSTLLAAGDAKDAALVEGARKFVVGAQVKGAANATADGGFGYEAGGGGRGSRPDLDNTVFALEALRQFRESPFAKEVPKGEDLNWQAALDFVSRCQQLPATNKEKWVSDAPEEKGGFVYTPDGGGDRGPAGEKAPRSYGTMTYAGVLSFIYADLKKDDPRLVAALDWIARHYTLEENPGQGAQGLYYYYHMMAKGLSVAGVGQLATADGRKVNWRAELAGKLLALQKADGSWSSENGRWMEKDPNLVTAYCLLALNRLHEGL
jgi:squalene-hopene/tetraprenyl-beta-curcumene cyclase